MASITNQANGRRTIQFRGADGKRRSIRLGKVSKRAAGVVKMHVERLVESAFTGDALADDTARWVARLDETMHDKLSAVGLVAKRQRATLGAFLDAYIASRTDVVGNTLNTYRQTRRSLIDRFGPNKPLRDITPGDVDEFRLWLLRQRKAKGDGTLAETTVDRRLNNAKQFFRAAVRKRIISENPFEDVTIGTQANEDRVYFVPREDVEKIIRACPDAEWRAIVALARYGGLRCPSELLALQWRDIDWEAGRMTVLSPKTKKRGKPYRVTPIFPELRPYLEELFEMAEPGSTHVITIYRKSQSCLRSRLFQIMRIAGVEPWEKQFQNMRSSRQTELEERFPTHVVCAWMGNSPKIANKHYLQVTAEHYDAALEGGAKSGAESGAAGARRTPDLTLQDGWPNRGNALKTRVLANSAISGGRHGMSND